MSTGSWQQRVWSAANGTSGQREVRGLLGMRDTHEDSYTHRQTQRLNVNIWTSLQSCCASDPLEHLKENLFPACLSDTGRAEETDPEMFCTNMHVTINPMLTFVTFDFSHDVNSARIIPPPHERTIIFWTATGDKLCWALWVKSFIVVIFIVVSETQDTSEIWGPVSFSPQVLWVYIYMETCSVSVSKYQDMLFTNGQHKWVREKKKYSFCIKLFSFLLRAAAATCPDRLNCVTDRSRGLWACQGHRRATHPILLPPAVTMSHKAQQARLVTRVPPLVPSKWDGGRQQKTTRIAGYGVRP